MLFPVSDTFTTFKEPEKQFSTCLNFKNVYSLDNNVINLKCF